MLMNECFIDHYKYKEIIYVVMSNIDEIDVQKWILLTLYSGPRSIRGIFSNGCKIMVYGREPDDFKKTLFNMIDKGLVAHNSRDNYYEISEDGVFRVHKDIFLPYLDLDENAINTLVSKLRKESDRIFINSLKNKNDDSKKHIIMEYGEKHLPNILMIISIIATLSAL